ncbi:hypothetical protein BJF85_14205 [Saccharomonospora sp. CUA-673]|uniref:DUF3558 domain-containing protein n=1 Tax=Saccharomonospora sp. CUA-673 TaxID=1904969 RepID=UPI0009677C7D|nr:DUF3558 domain-containing protein [Saccharomonospora sp. CUA-673]OLT48018.1 hypothetical protein BJF85_14205 [Saccharomonospora sp. CUA-673]
MKQSLKAVAVGAVGLLVVGCGGETDGEAEPGPGRQASPPTSADAPSSPAAQDELPHSGAPAVSNPLPESVLSGDPCIDPLTDEQATELLGDGVQTAPDNLDALGPGCRWSNLDTGASFSLSYDTVTRQGLSSAYANAQSQRAVFNEIGQIEGFPAVEYKNAEDDVMCTTVLGLADEYGLVLSLTVGDRGEEQGDDPCEGGRIVMGQVVTNLKAKA